MFSPYNLDIHKDAISIPGLSLKSLWSSEQPGIEFELFKDKEELYEHTGISCWRAQYCISPLSREKQNSYS